ncbi:MAG: hypothetical protein JNM00_01655, partial [Flavobacteriales bacterium]|nr:hypothetical protein [Flavobacteriales bacterium]
PAGPGSVTLTYTFTNAAGCTSSDQMVVNVIAPTTANAGPDLEYCQSATAILLTGYSPAGGTWSGTNVTAGGSFTPNTAGSYTLTYTYGAGSCQTQDQLVVTVNALPLVNAGADVVICAGQTAQLSGSVSGGEAPYGTPSWNNISTLSANNILNPVANPATTTTYTLTVSDNNSCTSNDQVTVTVNALPVVNAGPDLSLCDQPIPVTLTGFSPAGGTWSGSPQVTPAGVFTPSGTGSFVLTYTFTNASGCTNSDVMTVNVASATPANAGPDLDACLNAPAINLPVGGTWSGSPLVTPGGVFTPSAVGVYNLTFSTGVGTCLTTDQMVLEVVALPVTNAGPDQTICAGQTVQLNASATSSNGSIFLYTWSGGTVSNSTISNPTATPASTTTYTVNVVDSLGCSDPDQVTVFVNALPVVNAGPDITLCDQAIPHQLT